MPVFLAMAGCHFSWDWTRCLWTGGCG